MAPGKMGSIASNMTIREGVYSFKASVIQTLLNH